MPSIATAKTVRVKKTKTTTTVVKKKKKKKKRARKPAPRRRHTGPTLVDRRLAVGTFGLRLGLSSAKTFCDCVDEPDVDRISGGLIGITKDTSINPSLSYRLEGLLVSKGTEQDIEVPNAAGELSRDTRELTLSYLELGAQLLMRATMSRAFTAYFGGGPYLAALMDVDARVDGKKERGFDKDVFESGDYGISITGGMLFGVNRHMGLLTSLQLTYSHGVADIDNHNKSRSDEDDTLHNRAFYISGGAHF